MKWKADAGAPRWQALTQNLSLCDWMNESDAARERVKVRILDKRADVGRLAIAEGTRLEYGEDVLTTFSWEGKSRVIWALEKLYLSMVKCLPLLGTPFCVKPPGRAQ
ncbi:uncharacterized protein PGTG_15685 [Puccinia graminis f. sp. tritici CRL 75-36-700-3]|uniref:Uncharacterized protein n=1 Tax=Puccinia graminis f. sp. tritici (strain CRL 75-36-700-3 / race SCCL) TaxID=418459 RepID=E3KZ11_PUCGT|nr:uncharacterized protein PGTG_15685 [Puccinia graminis f. sp. tritici CRL 75-36-700-3]EFP89536.1 hypothetical protein PGTG_15685 [Puccinia graminis f. sp. tritici CRL 75-36-700-3]